MGEVGIRSHRVIQADQGFLIASKLHERDAKIELKHGIAWFKRDCAVQMPDTFFKPPRLGQCQANKVPSICVARFALEQINQGGFGFRELTLAHQCNAFSKQ